MNYSLEWIICENALDPIISEEIVAVAQKIIQKDLNKKHC
jgi:hypothetical protein